MSTPENESSPDIVAFCRTQLMQLASTSKDEKVRVLAIEDLLKLEGSFRRADKLVDQQYGSSAGSSFSLAIQQNVLSGTALESLKKNLVRVVSALPTDEEQSND